jgi:hypothetical protein
MAAGADSAAHDMTRAIHRTFAALFALWFTVLTVEPERLHSCPMHGGGGAVASAGHVGGHMGHAAHELAMSHESSAHPSVAEVGHPVPEQHHAHQCTCPDRCCCTAVHALAAFAEDVAPAAGLVTVPVALVEESPAVARPELVLPPSTAPPSMRLV